MTRRMLDPSSIRPPFARYAHGVEVAAGHRLVVTSGQLGIAADETVPEDAGAQAAALSVQPDFSFGLDTTIAYDVPGSQPHERCTTLGDGAAIKLMDSSVICDYRMIEYMKATAKKAKIKWQPEILSAGGTDTASLQRMVAGGSIAGAVSIPTRHVHQSIESCHKSDLAACVDLLAACVRSLDSYDWSF